MHTIGWTGYPETHKIHPVPEAPGKCSWLKMPFKGTDFKGTDKQFYEVNMEKY